MSIAAMRKAALGEWWGRTWPVVVLGVDPGRESGAALIHALPGSIRLVWAREVLTQTMGVERAIDDAIRFAGGMGLPLVMAVEDWGAGGSRGLAQWIGLGEQRGAWTRALALRCLLTGVKPKVVKIPQTRWRSRLCEAHGSRNGAGKFERHNAAEWKRESIKAARLLIPDADVPISDNAAEAVCIGYFAARADVTAKALGKTHLRKHAIEFVEVEGRIHPKRAKGVKR